MFCPKCSSYLTEDEIKKRDSKYTPDGGTVVEYSAYCPRCSVEMGKMFWGRFIVNPDLVVSFDPLEGRTAEAAQSSGEKDGIRSESGGRGKETKCCPHCGLPLPEGY